MPEFDCLLLSLKPRALRLLVFAHVKAHPGCTRSDLFRHLGGVPRAPWAKYARIQLGRIVVDLIRRGLLEECAARPEVAKFRARGLCVPSGKSFETAWPAQVPDPRTIERRLAERERRWARKNVELQEARRREAAQRVEWRAKASQEAARARARSKKT